MIATVPCPRHKPGCAPSAAEHCFPAGESRKGVSYGVQQHLCLSHGHGHGVLRADLPDRADLSHERRGGPWEKGRPGNILAVNVTAGQAVKKGDVLMVLEAMKMENEIMCPRDGVVASVNTSKGASVESGTLLCVLQ